MTEAVAPGVFVVPHRVAEGKNAVIVGTRAALAVDTGSDPDEGAASVAVMRAQGFAPDRLLLTHGHGDHILGSRAFPEAEIFASARFAAVAEREVGRIAAREGVSPEAVRARFREPTVTFTDALRLDLGGRWVQFLPAPGHSADGIAAFVEDSRTLIAADAVVTGIVPAIADGDSRTLRETLRRLAALDAAVLVPGHGPVIVGAAAVQEWLAWLGAYLDAVWGFADDGLRRGDEPEAIVAGAAYDRFIGDRLPRDRHRMEWRHANTVRKIVAERRESASEQQ